MTDAIKDGIFRVRTQELFQEMKNAQELAGLEKNDLAYAKWILSRPLTEDIKYIPHKQPNSCTMITAKKTRHARNNIRGNRLTKEDQAVLAKIIKIGEFYSVIKIKKQYKQLNLLAAVMCFDYSKKDFENHYKDVTDEWIMHQTISKFTGIG